MTGGRLAVSNRRNKARNLAGVAGLLAVLLCLLLPAQARAAATPPGFELETTRTFAPGETPRIEAGFRGVGYLDFRIYKVNNPVRFFEQLKNPHQFGGPPPRIPQTPTLIERWHRWKRQQREWFRSLVRSQFRFATRQAWVQRHERKQVVRRMPLHVSRFAQVPLLNRDQLVLSWREVLPRTRDWEHRRIPVDVRKPGLYVVEAVSGELRAYTIVLITNVAIVTKAAPGQIVTFVARRDTGQPLARATTLVYADRKLLTRGATDANGLFTTPLTGEKPQDMVVLAQTADGFAATDLASWYINTAPQQSWRGYLYTERPVYRPGQTVYFKGILRARQNGRYLLPTGHSVTVSFKDAERKTFLTRTFQLDSFGSFQGSLQLGKGVPLGMYTMEAQVSGTTGDSDTNASGSFSVEEYRRPEYKVTVKAAQPRVLEGNPNQLDVQATYYYGSPVAGAQVKWAVYTSTYWSPYRWSIDDSTDFGDSDDGGDGGYFAGNQIAQGQGRLDANGHLRITVPTSVDTQGKSDYRYRIVARVTDEANREISGAGSFIATYATFLAAIEPERYLYQPGETAHLLIRSVDYDGKPVAAQFKATVRRWSGQKNDWIPLYQTQVATGSNGQGSFDYPVTGTGSEDVRITAWDATGREVSGSTSLWISGETQGGGEGSVRMVTDRKTYAVGDTAKVLVMLPAAMASHGQPAPSGPVSMLVTTEVQQVRTTRIVQVSGRSTTLQVPVTADDSPNVYVDVAYLQAGQLYTGEVNLKAPPVQQKLNVAITTDKPVYKPRQTATVTVKVTDAAGHPVRAEVSLGVVDESVYAIRPESAPNILHFFYRTAYNQVYTTFSTDYDFSGWAGRAAMQLAALRHAYQLTDFKGQKGMAQPQVRKQFQETAYWQADLVTGADGIARAQVHFPDSLTAWRFTARAVTRGTRVGSATADVITRKNLILQMALPRFAVQKDQFTVYSIVHNYLKQTKAATMTLSAQGLALTNPAPQQATVATNGQARVAWQLQAQQPGTATLLGKALTDEESDALQMSFPVLPYGMRMDIPIAGSLNRRTSSDTVVQIPANTNPSGSVLDLDVTPSLSGTLFASLNWLVQYPYGCTEQTVSTMIPDLVVNQALKQLHLPPVTSQDDVDARIRTGLDRLANSQNSDGGWGWWPSTPSDPFMTADAVMALAQARAAGYPVADSLLNGGVNSINSFLAKYPRMVPELRAWLVYAGAQAGGLAAGELEKSWNQRAQLHPYGTALLALAMEAAHDHRAASMAASLAASAQSNAIEAWWSQTDDPLLDSWYDTTPEATAWALKALVELQPSSPLIPKAVRWLIAHRDGGYWVSTKQTAAIVDALTDYLKQGHELKPDFTARIQVNGKTVLQRRFTAADVAAQPVQVEVPIQPGAVHLAVTKQGDGTLYWTGAAHYPSLDDHVQRMGSYKLNIVRRYYRLTPRTVTDSDGVHIEYHATALNGPVAPGDLLLVRLTVTGDNQRYLMVEDPFPAGTEPVERDDLYRLDNRPPWFFPDYDRRELHDDHVSFFQTDFSRGQEEFTYLLKVILPGAYQVMPARVGPMYEPSKLATTEKMTLVVKETQP